MQMTKDFALPGITPKLPKLCVFLYEKALNIRQGKPQFLSNLYIYLTNFNFKMGFLEHYTQFWLRLSKQSILFAYYGVKWLEMYP